VDRHRRLAARARCRQVLGELDIAAGRQLSVADIRGRVQLRRGRPLRLMPVVTRPGWPSGMWLETEDTDVVLFDAATSPLHQVDIIAHEFGHIMLGHTGTAGRHWAGPMFRWPGADTAATVRWRTGFDDHEEHEAEVFATMVCARISDHRLPSVVPTAADSDDLVGRLLSALADPSTPR
jgi:hypothetical protein